MPDAHYEEWLNKPITFKGEGHYELLEILHTDTPPATFIQHKSMTEDHVVQWTKTQAQPTQSTTSAYTRIFVLRATEYYRNGHHSLPCSRKVFELVTEAWHIPTQYFAVVESHAALKLAGHDYGLSLNSHWFRTTMYHDITSQITTVFLAFRGSVPDDVLSNIKDGLAHHVPHPVLLSILCVEIEIRRYIRPYHRWIKGYLNTIRTWLGMNPYEDHKQAQEDSNQDLVAVMKRLTNCAQVIQGLKFDLSTSLKLCAALQDMIERMNMQSAQRPQSAVQAASDMMGIRLHNLMAIVEELQERMVLREQETQAQMQTLYTLVALRDNAISRQSADAAVQLAEAASRDSTDMRVIAGVTLIFLPATFVATFFSTSFFDFHPSHGVVSGWVWLYWVITAALSGLVVAGWIVVSRTMRKRPLEPRVQKPRLAQMMLMNGVRVTSPLSWPPLKDLERPEVLANSD